MKRFLDLKMWGYLLMIALCVSFTACSENDDEGGPGGGNSNGHWGSSIQYSDNEGYSGSLTFTYDNQGRIIKIVDREVGDDEDWITTYTYEDDKITEIEREDGYENWYFKIVYYLNDKGLIVSSKSAEYNNGQIWNEMNKYYEYDEQNRLVRRGKDYPNDLYDNNVYWYNIIWENENIVSDSYSNIISYTNKADVRGINGLIYGFSDDYGFLYASGYFGKKSANLIESDGENTYSYTFEGDKVKTMTVDYYGSETERFTFNY